MAFGPHSFEFQTFSFPLWVVFPFSGNNGFGVGPVFNFPRLKSKTCLSDKYLVHALLKRSAAGFSSAVKMHRVAVISDKLWSRTLKSENRLISLNRLKYLVPKLPNSMRGCSLWQFRLYRKLAAWFPRFSIIRNLPRSCRQFKAFGWPIIIPSLFTKDDFLTVAVLKSHSKHKIISASDLWVFKFCRYSIASWQQQTF